MRDAFALAKEKAPTIIFIDELDAIGTKRFDSDKSGDREVQRTMLELLNQLDGFGSDDRIKVSLHSSVETAITDGNAQVIAATNRIDILDPALLRSGRLDRKIEFPLPTEEARARIMESVFRCDFARTKLTRIATGFTRERCKCRPRSISKSWREVRTR